MNLFQALVIGHNNEVFRGYYENAFNLVVILWTLSHKIVFVFNVLYNEISYLGWFYLQRHVQIDSCKTKFKNITNKTTSSRFGNFCKYMFLSVRKSKYVCMDSVNVTAFDQIYLINQDY